MFSWLKDSRHDWGRIFFTNGLYIAVLLFGDRSQVTSKCDENKKKEALEAQPRVSPMFLPYFGRLLWGNMEPIYATKKQNLSLATTSVSVLQ